MILDGMGYDPTKEEVRPDAPVYEMVFGSDVTTPINWKPYLAPREQQYWIPFCVTFSRLNCGEAKAIKEGCGPTNLSDRYLGVISGTSKVGNGLDQVSEAFRKQGVVKEDDCPWGNLLDEGGGAWDRIFDLSGVPSTARKYMGGDHSWVYGKQNLKNALAFSPVQIAVGVGNNWEADVVVDPKTYGAYHAITCYWIDDNGNYLIQDSIGKEFKTLDAGYSILYAKSFRDLTSDWKDTQYNMAKLERKKGAKEVFLNLGGRRYWIKDLENFNDIQKAQPITINWSDVQEVDIFTTPYTGEIIGKANLADALSMLFGMVK